MSAMLIPPLSKSDAHRALVLADILGAPSPWPADEPMPSDVEVIRDGLAALHQPESRIDCRDGGAPFRFLLTQAAVMPGKRVEFAGTQRLGERPHGPLFEALRPLSPTLFPPSSSPPGALTPLQRGEGVLPLLLESAQRIEGPVHFRVTGTESSQFASSLLLGAARLVKNGIEASVTVDGAMTSEGYFALTKRWVERVGFDVSAAQPLSPTLSPLRREREFPRIPGDWSSIGYLLALSWVTNLPVARIEFGTGHPDEAIATHLRSVGLTITARLSGTASRGFDVDCEQCPDAIPTLAVIASKLPAPSTFRRTGILRHKESDRLAATVDLLRAAGLRAEVSGDSLTVHPGTAHAFSFDARDDHRMAMSSAVLARLHDVRVDLHGRECVAKSFPTFWREAAKAGIP